MLYSVYSGHHRITNRSNKLLRTGYALFCSFIVYVMALRARYEITVASSLSFCRTTVSASPCVALSTRRFRFLAFRQKYRGILQHLFRNGPLAKQKQGAVCGNARTYGSVEAVGEQSPMATRCLLSGVIHNPSVANTTRNRISAEVSQELNNDK